MNFILDIIAALHTVAVFDVHGVMAVCQLTVSQGNVFANDCNSVGI